MPAYALSKKLIIDCFTHKTYITQILFHFANEKNAFKVSLDKSGKIISMYEDVAKTNHLIYFWVDLMSKLPSGFEIINVDIDSHTTNEEVILLDVCKHTNGGKNIIISSHQDWMSCNYAGNTINYDGVDLNIFDKDEAILELHQRKDGDIYNIINSNVATNNSKIKDSNVNPIKNEK